MNPKLRIIRRHIGNTYIFEPQDGRHRLPEWDIIMYERGKVFGVKFDGQSEDDFIGDVPLNAVLVGHDKYQVIFKTPE